MTASEDRGLKTENPILSSEDGRPKAGPLGPGLPMGELDVRDTSSVPTNRLQSERIHHNVLLGEACCLERSFQKCVDLARHLIQS